MALQIYYNTNDDDFRNAGYGASIRGGQTFTTVGAFTLGSVKFKLYRIGSPGTLTFRLYATSANLPTGSILATGSMDADTLTTDSAGEWVEITLDSPYALSATTKYALTLLAASGDASNRVAWRADGPATGPDYAGGGFVYSTSGDGGWVTGNTYDLMFETYDSGAVYVDLSATVEADVNITSTMTVELYIDTSCSIEGDVNVTASMDIDRLRDMSSVITGTVTIGSTVTIQVNRPTSDMNSTYFIKRIVVASSDQIWYEA